LWVAEAILDVPARHLRRGRLAISGGRDLRRDVLLSYAAHARDWDKNGSGRRTEGRGRVSSQARNDYDLDWGGRRTCRSVCSYARDVEPFVRSQRARSVDVRGNLVVAWSRRFYGEFCAGSTSDQSRSNDCASI